MGGLEVESDPWLQPVWATRDIVSEKHRYCHQQKANNLNAKMGVKRKGSGYAEEMN